MNSSLIIHQAKLTKWADLFHEQQSSGLTVAAWCRQHELSKTRFYYWKRKLKDQFVSSQLPEIVPITSSISQQCFTSCTTDTTLSASSSLTISIKDVSIEITESTSSELISRVIKAVRHA